MYFVTCYDNIFQSHLHTDLSYRTYYDEEEIRKLLNMDLDAGCRRRNDINLMFVDPCIIVQFLQKNPTRYNNVLKFIIAYLHETEDVSGDTPPIIRSLKLH